MTRLAALATLVTACSFSAVPTDPGAAPDSGTATTGDGASLFVGCHIADPSLRLCLDFEDPVLSPTVRDGSQFSHDASTQNLAAMTRAGEQAAMFGSSSQATIAATPDFDVMKLTVEAWMKPSDTLTVSWALLNSQHYGIGVGGGNITCVVGNKVMNTSAAPYAGQWIHVACTNDGMKLALYVNGSSVNCTDAGPKPRGTSSLSIGDGLSGGLDNVRLFAAVLPPADICAHAGRTACTASCAE